MTLKVRFWHYQVTKYNNLLEENHQGNFVKFGYSEKATKFEKIFHLKFDATQYRQNLSGRFFQILWPSQNIRPLLWQNHTF